MPAPALQAINVAVEFAGLRALDGVSLCLEPGEILGLIGPNGSGKTTLINCISGAFRTEPSTVVFNGEDITRLPPHVRTRRGIARSFQIPRPFRSMTVIENLMVAADFTSATHLRLTAEDHRDQAMGILGEMGLADKANARVTGLSQVELRKMELARAMALEPNLILLDEPMAGMNFEEKEDMARYIVELNEEFGMTVVMIEHDMGVVMDISHRVMVLDFGRKIAEGEPAAVLADPHVKRAYLGEADEVLKDPDDAPKAEASA